MFKKKCPRSQTRGYSATALLPGEDPAAFKSGPKKDRPRHRREAPLGQGGEQAFDTIEPGCRGRDESGRQSAGGERAIRRLWDASMSGGRRSFC
jgi:hypothetical protein